jgi:lauroyl/myristoyl acyltransferase
VTQNQAQGPQKRALHYDHVSKNFYRAAWFEAASRIATLLPRRLLRLWGGWAGLSYALLAGGRVARVERNWKRVVPHAQRQLVAAAYAEFGRVLGDYFYLARRPPEAALELIEEKKGYEHLRRAAEKGNGALLVSIHLSFFELGGLAIASLGFPMVALSFPEPDPGLSLWRAEYRKRWGMETLEVGTDPFISVKIRNAWRMGKFVAALLDRPFGGRVLWLPFPGGEVPCATSILLLAHTCGVPILPVVVLRTPRGRYRVEAFAPLESPPGLHAEKAVLSLSEEIFQKIGPLLLAHPDQWFPFAPLGKPEKNEK